MDKAIISLLLVTHLHNLLLDIDLLYPEDRSLNIDVV
jgi:hypothetical protein